MPMPLPIYQPTYTRANHNNNAFAIGDKGRDMGCTSPWVSTDYLAPTVPLSLTTVRWAPHRGGDAVEDATTAHLADMFAVVGEQHRMDNVAAARAAVVKEKSFLPPRMWLVPDDNNAHDTQAVRVYAVVQACGIHIGFLPRSVARHFRNSMALLDRKDQSLEVCGCITYRNGSDDAKAWLYLPLTFAELIRTGFLNDDTHTPVWLRDASPVHKRPFSGPPAEVFSDEELHKLYCWHGNQNGLLTFPDTAEAAVQRYRARTRGVLDAVLPLFELASTEIPQGRATQNPKQTAHSPTPYQACYFAHDLSRRCAPDDPDRINGSVFDASIDLNPHQIDAALFALESPFAAGVLLADEVGLGKTVEAGLLLAQRWAEGRRRLLVVAPASLTRQWADELQDKFHLPATVLTSATYAADRPPTSASPWASEGVIICSYHFAANREASLRKEYWDLVVLDEAHRLRNAYKPNNKIGQTLRDVFTGVQKVLLTATPLQNSLMELYGLMSIIDTHLFGDVDSFKVQYGSKRSDAALRPLADRIAPYCRRTLRRDVAAYIKWTARKAHLVTFRASAEEQALYEGLSDYLSRPALFAIPSRTRHLMGLMLRKLQASSPAALAGTLESMRSTLSTEMGEDAARCGTAQAIADDCDSFSTLVDEWSEEDCSDEDHSTGQPTPVAWSKDEEYRALTDLIRKARNLTHCSKADALIKALSSAFEISQAARQRAGLQAMQPKAIIFTESRRTQAYLQDRLKEILPEQQVVLFNGTNDGAQARQIVSAYRAARAGTDLASGNYSVDARAALVAYFRTDASVMIATEAAAEGLNLQFCNLVVNFDLPWNPQRIEQRIGRCHRYGQRCDVVVMNFLNDSNAADKRVYELLDTKCRLFEGVFGASDEILGAIGSDFDFEKRVAAIYESCRTPEQIDKAFTALQHDLEKQIAHATHTAVDKLFARFNPDVTDRVRTDARQRRSRTGKALWQLTKHVLADFATFDEEAQSFVLNRAPDASLDVPLGRYSLPRSEEAADAPMYRLTHALAKWVLARGRTLRPAAHKVVLHAPPQRVGAKSGWCLCSLLTTSGVSASEVVVGVSTGNADWRAIIQSEGTVGDTCSVPDDVMLLLRNQMSAAVRHRSRQADNRNLKWVAREKAKLQAWSRDCEIAIEKEIEHYRRKADAAACAISSTDEGGVLSASSKAIREEQVARQRVVDLTERLLDTRRKASAEQGSIVMRLLKECEAETHVSELFVFQWHCGE